MFRLPILIFLLTLPYFTFGQTQKPADDGLSYINLPISLKYTEIDNFIDKQMNGILYDDTSYTDNNNDNMTTRVKKNGVVKIVGLTEGMLIDMPLRIWFSKKIAGYTFNTDFDLSLQMVSKVSVGPQWNIVSKSTLRTYKITRDPVMKLAGTGLDIKYLVQLALDKSLPDILREVDSNFAKSDMLRKQATEAWHAMQQPVVVDTTYHSWVRILPEAFYMEPLRIYRDELDINAAIEAHIYTGIGKPKPVMERNLRDVILKDKLDNAFRISVRIELPYTDISAVASKMLADTTFNVSKKVSFKVTSFNVVGSDSAVTASISTAGSLNATVNLLGLPAYIDSTQEFYLSNFNYTLESDQSLLRIADRLFKEKLRSNFDKAMHYSVRDQLNTARNTITTFLSDYRLYNKLLISGSLTRFGINHVASDSDMIYAIFDLQGQARMQLLDLGK